MGWLLRLRLNLCPWLKLNSDLGVELSLCLELRLGLNMWHWLDLAAWLDLNLCTDWGLRLGVKVRLWGSHGGDDRGNW